MGYQDMFGNVIDSFLFPVAHGVFPYSENRCRKPDVGGPTFLLMVSPLRWHGCINKYPPLSRRLGNPGAGSGRVSQYYFLSAAGTSGWCSHHQQAGFTPTTAARARTLQHAGSNLLRKRFMPYTSFNKRWSIIDANRWPARVKVKACHQVPKLTARTRAWE